MWCIKHNGSVIIENVYSIDNCIGELSCIVERLLDETRSAHIYWNKTYFTFNNTDTYWTMWVEPKSENALDYAKKRADLMKKKLGIDFCVYKNFYICVVQLSYANEFGLSNKIIYKT